MNKIKYLTIDEAVNVFVVGDIHGCYSLLIQKLKELNFNFLTDLLISVGDLVDRGFENEKCFNLLKEPWFVSVKGNHEDFCVKGFLNDTVAYSHKAHNNGGSWFYELNEDLQHYISKHFNSLPILLEVSYKNKKFGFVHADVPSNDWEKLKQEINQNILYHGRYIEDLCLWSRNLVYKDSVNILNIDNVFLGHTVLPKIKQVGNCTFLDTGAVFNGNLSIVNLNDYLNT